ncbi:MAG TPA: histidine phosphatase family protein [Steroidobacteraceae bacterium]|nr:histidine phosphatase family protein [Steroidobacteraceae bacterium]
MVRVYLIRHAAAFERDARRWPDDRLRPLTPDGMRKFRKAAAGLERLAGTVTCVLTSPLVRARQTAEILATAACWAPATEAPELAPGHTPAQVLAVMRTQSAESFALVGHEPGLSDLLAASVVGPEARFACQLKKGGAACLNFAAAVRVGRARLDWLITPKALRSLA